MQSLVLSGRESLNYNGKLVTRVNEKMGKNMVKIVRVKIFDFVTVRNISLIRHSFIMKNERGNRNHRGSDPGYFLFLSRPFLNACVGKGWKKVSSCDFIALISVLF